MSLVLFMQVTVSATISTIQHCFLSLFICWLLVRSQLVIWMAAEMHKHPSGVCEVQFVLMKEVRERKGERKLKTASLKVRGAT